tara:strand:+ start:383 stop:529 length:147 start_codon:yes stop_codon:yes gene_type:complete
MNFNHPTDTKHFIIGLAAAVAGVVIWDIIKYSKGLFEHKYPTIQADEK